MIMLERRCPHCGQKVPRGLWVVHASQCPSKTFVARSLQGRASHPWPGGTVSAEEVCTGYGAMYHIWKVVEPRGLEPLAPCLQSPVEPFPHKTHQGYPHRPNRNSKPYAPRHRQKHITTNQPTNAQSHLIQYKYPAFRLCRIRLIYVRPVRS